MSDMESRVRALEINEAVQDTKLDALTLALKENTDAINKLTNFMSKGKGLWAGVAVMGTLLGFVIATSISFFKGS